MKINFKFDGYYRIDKLNKRSDWRPHPAMDRSDLILKDARLRIKLKAGDSELLKELIP